MGEVLQQPEKQVTLFDYETKCRRCGSLWEKKLHIFNTFIKCSGQKAESLAVKSFNNRMKQGFKNSCLNCEKETIHDLVSFKTIACE